MQNYTTMRQMYQEQNRTLELKLAEVQEFRRQEEGFMKSIQEYEQPFDPIEALKQQVKELRESNISLAHQVNELAKTVETLELTAQAERPDKLEQFFSKGWFSTIRVFP